MRHVKQQTTGLAGILLCLVATTTAIMLMMRPSDAFSPARTASRQTRLVLASTTTPPEKTVSLKSPMRTSMTPEPSYPTLRGSEVDARKIVASSKARQHLEALHLHHILFASDPLAQEALLQLRAGQTVFADLAQLVSACAATRDEGGRIGWMSVQEEEEEESNNDDDDSNAATDDKDHDNVLSTTTKTMRLTNEHLDEILPRAARETLVQMTTKPGDVVLVESTRGVHLIQVVDLMANVRKMAHVKGRTWSWQGGSQDQLLSSSNEASKRTDLTYKMETMGCQMNVADSERMQGQLESLGMRPFSQEDEQTKGKEPNVIVLNTCSIRDHAEQKVYSYLGPHAKRKREGQDVTIIIAGCVAQQEAGALLRRAPEVDLVMGPQYANRLGDLLEEVAQGNQVVATEASHIMEDATKPRRQSTVAAWTNVIYGCNERCTFCIVPTTRGVEQSRPVESIVREITGLVQDEGYKEVTLLGQNIDAYGRDMVPKRKFSDLLRTVGSIPGLARLRFVTSHPRYMSMGVVDAVAETPAACECFHIPFQSGSNDVLAAMGRGHTREKYLRIVDRIRARIPDAAITADVIVGFPGETEEQFEDTLALMKEVVFDSINTAAYSPRPNTPAANWENQVDEATKQDRLQRINVLNLEHAALRRARMMGRSVEVLVEERNVKIPTQVMGRTRHGYIVYCEGEIDELQGKLVHVLIDTCSTYHLIGKRVPAPEM